MLAFQTILHPTDFSVRSKQAFELACSLAKQHGARLVVLHVAEPVMALATEGVLMVPPQANREALQARLERVMPSDRSLSVEHQLEVGDTASMILETADRIGCDLIVLGTHGRSGIPRLLMGSVAEQVLRKAPCPVVTVTARCREKQPVESDYAETECFAPASAAV